MGAGVRNGLRALGLLARSRRGAWRGCCGEQVDVEVTASFLAAVCAAAVLVAVFLSPPSPGRGSPRHELVAVLPLIGALASWGLRRFPRAGALLGVLGCSSPFGCWCVRADGDAGVAPPRGALPWTVRSLGARCGSAGAGRRTRTSWARK